LFNALHPDIKGKESPMARRPRLDMAGFHHIVNRGVAKENVYRCDEDKEKYLEILCKACKTYKVNVHDYCYGERFHMVSSYCF